MLNVNLDEMEAKGKDFGINVERGSPGHLSLADVFLWCDALVTSLAGMSDRLTLGCFFNFLRCQGFVFQYFAAAALLDVVTQWLITTGAVQL